MKRRLFRVLVLAAACDGAIQDEERELLEDHARRLGIQEPAMAALIKTALAKGKIEVYLPKQPSDRERLLATTLDIIVADGLISASEERLFCRLAKGMGIANPRAKEMLSERLNEHEQGAEDLKGPLRILAESTPREARVSNCPHCKDELALSAELFELCPACSALYHQRCLRSLERCASSKCNQPIAVVLCDDCLRPIEGTPESCRCMGTLHPECGGRLAPYSLKALVSYECYLALRARFEGIAHQTSYEAVEAFGKKLGDFDLDSQSSYHRTWIDANQTIAATASFDPDHERINAWVSFYPGPDLNELYSL